MDPQTVWQKKRFGRSNLIAADGETTRQAPVIANGKLFVRDDQHVFCFDVQARK